MSLLRRVPETGEIGFSSAKYTPFGTIDCYVTIDETGEVIPYHVTSDDTVDYGIELYTLLTTTQVGSVSSCPQSEIDEAAEADVRAQRNISLAQSDWIALTDVALPNENDWLIYRQALRDITDQAGFPHTVTYPTAPALTKSVFVGIAST